MNPQRLASKSSGERGWYAECFSGGIVSASDIMTSTLSLPAGRLASPSALLVRLGFVSAALLSLALF